MILRATRIATIKRTASSNHWIRLSWETKMSVTFVSGLNFMLMHLPQTSSRAFFSCAPKCFHQKYLLRHIAERVTRITDNENRADELYTTESAVVRQSE